MTALAAVAGTPRWILPGSVVRDDSGWCLVGVACASCEAATFPSTPCCPLCGATDLRPEVMPAYGRIHAVTTIRVAPPGFDPPYLVGWVDFDNGVRVFGRVITRGESMPAVGDTVVVVPSLQCRDDTGALASHAFEVVL